MTQATTHSPFRSALATVPTYKAGKQPAAVSGLTPYKLSSNEHYLQPLPGVMEAIAEPNTPAAYPDPAASALTTALSEYLRVPTDHIAVGAGGSEIITALSHITLEPEAEVVYPSPSFELYSQAAALNGANRTPVGLTGELKHDLKTMAEAIAEHTRLVALCSPNNPTGPTISKDEFETFMAEVPSGVLVVLDEAYWEFITDPAAVNGLAALNDYDNLVLVRTLSKAHGLAGLRIGYAVAKPYVISEIRKALIPFSVTAPSQKAAIASLQRVDEVLERAKIIAAVRDEFVAALRAQGWDVPQAQANFVWLPLGELSTAFEDACVAQSLAVRNLNDGVRISIGEPDAMQRVLQVAAEFRKHHYPTA